MSIETEEGSSEAQIEHPPNETAPHHSDGSLALTLKDIQLTLKEVELTLKRQELQAAAKAEREEDKSKKLISSPLGVAILTGILGLIGIAVGNYMQTRASLTLEQQKFDFASKQETQRFESTLVLKAIETGDTKVAAGNLQFLIESGYLPDPGGKMGASIKDAQPGKGPVLPRSDATSRPPPGTCCVTCNGFTICGDTVNTPCGSCQGKP
jgi:hypothetical protein